MYLTAQPGSSAGATFELPRKSLRCAMRAACCTGHELLCLFLSSLQLHCWLQRAGCSTPLLLYLLRGLELVTSSKLLCCKVVGCVYRLDMHQ